MLTFCASELSVSPGRTTYSTQPCGGAHGLGVNVGGTDVAVTIMTARVGVSVARGGGGGAVVFVGVAVAVGVSACPTVWVGCSGVAEGVAVSTIGDGVRMEVGVAVAGNWTLVVAVTGGGVGVSERGMAKNMAAATVRTITINVAAPMSRRCIVEDVSLPFDINYHSLY